MRSIRDAVERAERLCGWKIDKAFVGVGGAQVESLNSTGQVSWPRTPTRSAATTSGGPWSRPGRSRSRRTARSSTSSGAGFTVDGQEGVKDPLGMSALRLEVETHIVTAPQTAVQNLMKCVAQAGVKIDELVVNALASAEAVANETERELGVAVADIGAGTIDLAMFNEGSPFRTSVLPIGGNFVTNDIAIGIKTSLPAAEELKVRHGTCDLRGIAEDEEIAVSVLGEEAGRTISRLELCQIIESRMRETFELIAAEIQRRRGRHAACRPDPHGRRGPARGRRRARARDPADAGPGRRSLGRGRPDRLDPDAGLRNEHRPAPVGRLDARRGRAGALRVRARGRRPGPAPERRQEHASLGSAGLLRVPCVRFDAPGPRCRW